MPSRATIDALRVPALVLLLAIAGFMLLPDPAGDAAQASPTPLSVEVTEIAGRVLETPAPTPTPPPTPTATPAATPVPSDAGDFRARVFACRSISGDECEDEVRRIDRLERFTALVRFVDASAGDALQVTLSGEAATLAGGPYTLEGGGNGYYYAIFTVSQLPAGDYTLIATRNGDEVARTRVVKRG